MFRNFNSLEYNRNLKDKTTLRNYAKLHLQGVSLYLILLGYNFTRGFSEEMQAVIKTIYSVFYHHTETHVGLCPYLGFLLYSGNTCTCSFKGYPLYSCSELYPQGPPKVISSLFHHNFFLYLLGQAGCYGVHQTKTSNSFLPSLSVYMFDSTTLPTFNLSRVTNSPGPSDVILPPQKLLSPRSPRSSYFKFDEQVFLSLLLFLNVIFSFIL